MRFAVIAALVHSALAGPAEAQQQVRRGWRVDADASIRIQVGPGRLRITGWDRDSIDVIGSIPPGGGSFYGGAGGKGAKLGVESRDPTAPGATLEVSVPHGARVWAKTVSAAVEVSGVDGEIDLISVSGPITVSGSPRVLTVEAIDGSVRTDGGHGVQRIRTGGGQVTIKAPSGDISVTTVGGGIEATVDRLDRGRLETVTGPVTLMGNVAPGGALETETHSADITLRLVGPVDAEFELATVGGVVHNKLVPKGSPQKGGKPVSFMLGSGGARISARSFKGAIIVTR